MLKTKLTLMRIFKMEQNDQVKNTESMGKDGIIPATNFIQFK